MTTLNSFLIFKLTEYIFTVTVSCGDIGNISEVVGWITEGGAENGKVVINTH